MPFPPNGSPSGSVADHLEELTLLRSENAALRQLLEVHEQTSLEQAMRLEQSLRERDELLARERRSRELLVEREEEFRTLANSIPQLAWMTDSEGSIVWYNQRWYDYTGTSFDEMRGWGWQSVHHPEHLDRVVDRFSTAIAKGEPWEDTFPLRGKDGQYRWFLSRAMPIRNALGRVTRWFGTNTDVTERLEIEAARDRALDEAKAERQRLYEVFMQAPAAIAVLEGPEHTFTVANPLYIELVGGRPVLGRALAEALPEVVGQGFLDLLDHVYTSGEPYVAREALVQLDRRGGGVLEDVYVNFVYQPLKTPNGTTFGIMAHAVDVTQQVRARREIEEKADELQRLTRELERSNKELDQFAYVASHDLKAPLRGIANLAQWIEEDLGDRVTGESKEHMQLLQGRVHRMEALIDGILAYSRAGRVRERPARVDVGALLQDVIELLSPPPETQVVIASEMPVIEAERVPLQQVFMNLVGNAIKYSTRRDARIEIRAEPEREEGGEFYRFAITDNGPGIARQYHEKIWQIFQTLAPRDKVEGTGIGLSVVRKIVEARGGRTWVESEPGHGSTFYFTWPDQQEH